MGGHSGSFLPLWMSHLLSQRPATGVACASGAPLCLGMPRWVSADRPRDVLPPRAFPEPAPEAGPSLGPWQSPGFPPALAAVAPGADSLPWHGRPSGLGHCVRLSQAPTRCVPVAPAPTSCRQTSSCVPWGPVTETSALEPPAPSAGFAGPAPGTVRPSGAAGASGHVVPWAGPGQLPLRQCGAVSSARARCGPRAQAGGRLAWPGPTRRVTPGCPSPSEPQLLRQ